MPIRTAAIAAGYRASGLVLRLISVIRSPRPTAATTETGHWTPATTTDSFTPDTGRSSAGGSTYRRERPLLRNAIGSRRLDADFAIDDLAPE